MLKKLVGYLLQLFLVLGVNAWLVTTALAWSPPQECMHTAEYWRDINRQKEERIDRLRNNLSESELAHFERHVNIESKIGAVNDPMMRTLADPNFPNMSTEHRGALMNANFAIDQQSLVNPWGTPHAPGKNGLLDNQRFANEIPQLRSQIRATEEYIKRCFGGAYVEVSVSEGEYIAYNCSGLEGRWDFEIKRSFPEDTNGMGTFTVPPQPDEQEGAGRWLTPPFSFSLYGEAVQGDCDVIVIIEHTNAVMEIVVEQEFRSLNFTGMGDVEEFRTYNCPEGTYDISSPGSGYLPFAGEIIMDRHSRCP